MVILLSLQSENKCYVIVTKKCSSLQLLRTWDWNKHTKNVLVVLEIKDSHLIWAVQKGEQFPKDRIFNVLPFRVT